MYKETHYLHGVAVHVKHYSDSHIDGGRAWIKVMSERHANRMAALMDWHEYYGGPGRPFAHVWYDAQAKRLVKSFGWDC